MGPFIFLLFQATACFKSLYPIFYIVLSAHKLLFTSTSTHTHTHSHSHTAHMHTCTHTHIHTHTYTHTHCTHTAHMHTHIHTHHNHIHTLVQQTCWFSSSVTAIDSYKRRQPVVRYVGTILRVMDGCVPSVAVALMITARSSLL